MSGTTGTTHKQKLISETFNTRTHGNITIHHLPLQIDSQTGEALGYSMAVAGAIDVLLEQAKQKGLKELDFDPSFIPTQPTPNSVSHELRRAMLERGMNGAAIARALNVKPPLVSRWLSPRYHDHSLETIRRIADALDMDVEIKLKPRAS